MENRQTKKISGSAFDAKNIDIFAIITARGGSRRLPKKNIIPLNGKPLIVHTILAAKQCPFISRCFVSTDDQEIKEISLAWKAEVIDRPANLADDNALSKDVVRHALLYLEKEFGGLPDYFVLLQPTSPLRTADHLSACIELFFNSNANSAVSVTEAEHHPYKMFKVARGNSLETLFGEAFFDYPKQKLPRIYRTNGAIYLMSSAFSQRDSFYVKPVLPFVMSAEESVDIDTWVDFQLASSLLDKSTKTTG